MKSIITKLSTLFLCATFALVSCSDFSADLKQVNEELDALAEKSATKTEVAALSTAIDELKKKLKDQYATIEDVEAVITTVEGVQKSLNDAKTELVAALDTKADKTALQTAVGNLTDALTSAKTEIEGKFGQVDSDIESLGQKVESDFEALGQKIDADLKALKEALEGNLGNLEDKVSGIETSLGKVIDDVQKLDGVFTQQLNAFAEYKEEVEGSFNKIGDEITELSEAFADKLDKIKEEMSEKADAELVQTVTDLQNSVKDVNTSLSNLSTEIANKANKTDIEKVENTLASEIDALENLVKNWSDKDTVYDDTELRAAVAAATKEYKALVADLQNQIDSLEKSLDAIQGDLDDIKTGLRSIVAVPQTMYNGTKAVKFHKIEGENVLKTYADVSFHFNPANFDASTAKYEIVAEQVEFMTKGVFGGEQAIEIVGEPVQENGKVTFRLERAEGAGNMFALKATLADGSVIYSDYIAILDEATYCIVTAEASVEVSRLAVNLPSFTSLASIVEFVQSLGSTAEDFKVYIDAISEAVTAAQQQNILGAIEALSKVPGFATESTIIKGVGVHKVQVETLDAETILEDLKNAQTVAEITKILQTLLGKAEGLGATGDAIINGLQGVLNNSNINDLMSKLENLESSKLPSLTLDYESAKKTLEQYNEALEAEKAELEDLKAQLAAIIATLSTENQAKVEELYAKYQSASNDLEKLYYDGQITAIAGLDYLKVRFALFAKEETIKNSQNAIKAAQDILNSLEDEIKEYEAKVEEYKQNILDAAKDYIANSEVGQYIKELENALAEQGWNGKKMVAQTEATLFAMDKALADLINNYNSANEQVVDEFSESLFGRIIFLIQTQEAADAFEAIGLSEVHAAMKQIPDLMTMIIKYYPSSVKDLLTIVPDVTNVAWETEYLLAE